MPKNRGLIEVLLLAAVVVTAQGASAQVRVRPQPLAVPRASELPLDPLDQPTPRCVVDADTQFVRTDPAQITALRKLVRSEPSATGGAIRTHIIALKPTSDFWITRCPVIVDAQHAVTQSALCQPVSILGAGAASRLRIARTAGGMRFKLENTSLGEIKGRLDAIKNPHGAQEVTWLRSAQVTANGQPLNTHEFYVYLQDVQGYKSYLLEVFDKSDTDCLAAHLPGPATLCVNVDTDSSCLRGRTQALPAAGVAARNAAPQAQRAAPATGGSDGPGQQTATGGGHEPIER